MFMQVNGQVSPRGILCVDQRHFLISRTAFDLLLASNRVLDLSVPFKVDQFLHIVLGRESGPTPLLVLLNTTQ